MEGNNFNSSSWLGTRKYVDRHNNLFDDEIPNTEQRVTWDTRNDYIIKVEHVQGTTTLRTDDYTYNSGSTVETRTLNTGEHVTITTQVSTGDSTIEYYS